MKWPRWKRRTFIGLIIALAVVIVVSSETVQSCIGDYQAHYRSDNVQGGLASLGFVAGAADRCFGRFLHEDAEVLIGLFTLGLVSVTGVLAYYTYHLWKATGVVASEAKDSADATLIHLKESSERELRAYVSLREFNVTPIYAPGGSNKIEQWDISPRFENTGRTPARNISLHVNRDDPEEGLRDDFDFPDIPSNTSPSVGPIGPRVTITGSAAPIDRGMAMEIGMKLRRAFVWGHLDYDDVFTGTPRRTTQFAAEVAIRGDVTGNDPDLVRLRMLDRYNDAT
jgi:hypothetical protein